MGLFTRNFDKPGPGVSPDAPRKKGAARFFEILGRDFSTIWLAGILAMLGGLPFAAGVWFAVETHSLVPLVIAGVLGGMIAAPQIVGLNDTILRTLRDEPGYWWGDLPPHLEAQPEGIPAARRCLRLAAGHGAFLTLPHQHCRRARGRDRRAGRHHPAGRHCPVPLRAGCAA